MFSGIALQNLTTKEKVFPWLYHKNCDDFSYHNCLFGVHKSKESTGRANATRALAGPHWYDFSHDEPIGDSHAFACSTCSMYGNGMHSTWS